MKSETISLLIIAAVVSLLGWYSHNHGADNVTLLLTIGGGAALCAFGTSNKYQGQSFAAFVLIIVGLFFAATGGGFLVAGALLIATILSVLGTALFIENCW